MREPSIHDNSVSGEIVDAAIAVHRVLGPGFLESVYEEALAFELACRGISFQRQVVEETRYRGHLVGVHRMDLIVAGRVVVELKAVQDVLPLHVAQVISYLRATKLEVGLLINFNVRQLKHGVKRVVLTHASDTPS